MAAIPSYWHVEVDGTCFSSEVLPDGFVIGPEPSGATASLVDGATGEIHGEAILMCALPWPRFRGFFDGKQVILPHWHAETLERLENVMRPFMLEKQCPTCVRKLHYWDTHFRVEIADAKVKAFMCHDRCGSFLDGFHAVIPRQSSPPLGSGRSELSNPYARASSPRSQEP